MPVTQKVKFHSLVKSVPVADRTRLGQFIEKLFKREGKNLESLDYIFCSDKYLLQINKAYLKHDFLTDVITFDLSTSRAMTGEIYISADRVRQNAVTFKTSLREEFHRVIFHGALHLCGYKDKTARQQKEMGVAEDLYLKKYLKK